MAYCPWNRSRCIGFSSAHLLMGSDEQLMTRWSIPLSLHSFWSFSMSYLKVFQATIKECTLAFASTLNGSIRIPCKWQPRQYFERLEEVIEITWFWAVGNLSQVLLRIGQITFVWCTAPNRDSFGRFAISKKLRDRRVSSLIYLSN